MALCTGGRGWPLADLAPLIGGRGSWDARRMAGDSGSPEFAGFHGATLGAFQIALVVRAAILVACLVAWILRREPVPERARAEVPRELGDVQAA